MKNILIIAAAALALTACSSVSKADFDALKADVAKANQTAEQANQNANDAKAMSVKTDEKLNRMFKKSQMK